MKVILNKDYGGFSVSQEAHIMYAAIRHIPIYKISDELYTDPDGNNLFYLNTENREDPVLIKVVEMLGKAASGPCSCLKVVEIPDELKDNYMIDEYDGIETLHVKVIEY